jgi:uncharacterized protein YcfJ
MNVKATITLNLLLSAVVATVLAGCAATPMGPTVQVMPGPGRSFDTFQNDQASCKNYAAGQVQGQAEAANNQAVGGAVLGTVVSAGLGAAVGSAFGNAGGGAAIGAASGAAMGTGIGASNTQMAQMSIQQQYDNAFSQCMYSKGDQVAGYAPLPQPVSQPYVAAGPVADPMVRATQSELIRLGYLHDTADGFIGPKTRNGISSFESASGLPVDGSPSSSLLARLQATPTGSAPAPAPTASAPSNWVQPANAAPAPVPTPVWVAPAKPVQ